MTTRSFAFDAGSSFSPKNSLSAEMADKSLEFQRAFVERKSYDEFCLMIGSVQESNDLVTTKPRKLSYVHTWRQRVTPLDIGPPSSPFGTSEFPTSPVAVIAPDQLCVTSLPPYDPRAASVLARSPASDSPSEWSIVDGPTQFHDLYDAELEQMIDEAREMETSSASSSTISAGAYLPPAIHTTRVKAEKRHRGTFSSAVRWLPARIKYSLLSTGSAVQKVFRR
jgi:hypothetical protein